MLISIILVILFLSFLVVVHEAGHFVAARIAGVKVEEFGVGFPPAIVKKKIGETIYSINWLLAGGFVRLFGEERGEGIGDRAAGGFSDASWGRRAAIIVGGVLMNFVLGWLLISYIFMVGTPPGLRVTRVAPGSPAEAAGLQSGDAIAALLAPEEDFYVTGEDVAKRFSAFVDAHRGREISVEVRRKEAAEHFRVVPRADPPEGEGAMGVAIVEEGIAPKPILAALKGGLVFSGKMVLMFFWFIWEAVFGRADLDQVTGPVGIVKIAVDAGRAGLIPVVQLLAFISLNLAVINILPIPALDGGRLLFLIIEKIKGSPVSARVEQYAMRIGFAVLVAFLAVITIKDIIAL